MMARTSRRYSPTHVAEFAPANGSSNLWQQVEALIDPQVGIITGVYGDNPRPDTFGLFRYVAHIAHTEYHHAGKVRSGMGSSWALTREKACIRALGEALETYCVVLHGTLVPFVQAPFNQVRDQALDPSAMSLISPQEAALLANIPNRPVPFDPDAAMLWMWGTDLQTEQGALVPASMVYLPYPFPYDDPRIWIPTSSGLACGPSRQAATLSALLELVERDAFLVSWWNQLPRPRLPLATISADAQLAPLLARIAHRGLELVVNDLTLETGIPVYCAWLVDRSGHLPALSLGAAAHLDPRVALRKAIVEACHTRLFICGLLEKRGGRVPDYGPHDRGLVTFDDHMLLYSQPDRLARLEFLLDAPWGDEDLPSVLATGDAKSDLALCLQRLASAGMQAYCVDLTVPEVAACGFCVVRVLITGAQHLAPGPFRFLSNPRLYRMPRQLGYTNHDTRPDELNPFPHPFP